MGKIAKELRELKARESLVNTVENAEKLFEKVNLYYGLAKTGLDLVGIDINISDIFGGGGKASPFDAVIKEINLLKEELDKVFTTLEKEILASSELNTREKIQGCRTKAQIAVENTKDYCNNPTGEDHKRDFRNAQDDSQKTAEELRNNYWQRVYALSTAYDDHWSGALQPPECRETTPQLVWDYQFTLPAYLEAIAARAMVLLFTDPAYLKSKLDEFQNHADKLKSVFETILSGIILIRPPTADELFWLLNLLDDHLYYNMFQYYGSGVIEYGGPFPDEINYWFYDHRSREHNLNKSYLGKWAQAAYIYGAVETYSSYSCTAVYPEAEILLGVYSVPRARDIKYEDLFLKYSLNENFDFDRLVEFYRFYDRFVVKHTLRILESG